MLISTTVCHQGMVRERNEDSVIGNEGLGLWVVADGVGGNSNGDVASKLVVQTVERKIRRGVELDEAVVAAHNAIITAIEGQPDLEGMATTLVASLFQGNQFELAWVGDSRAYLINHEGISQLSSDHNLANELLLAGEIDEKEAHSHPGQHELTQAMGQMNLPKIPTVSGELHEGDVLLLCTDGLSGPLSDNEIFQVISVSETLKEAGETLLEKVLDAGAPDNIALSMVKFKEDDKNTEARDLKSERDQQNEPIKPPKFEGTLRHPFDKKAYSKHIKGRGMMLALVLFAIAFLIYFI